MKCCGSSSDGSWHINNFEQVAYMEVTAEIWDTDSRDLRHGQQCVAVEVITVMVLMRDESGHMMLMILPFHQHISTNISLSIIIRLTIWIYKEFMGILKVIGLNANVQDDYGHSFGNLMHIQSATSCTFILTNIRVCLDALPGNVTVFYAFWLKDSEEYGACRPQTLRSITKVITTQHIQ